MEQCPLKLLKHICISSRYPTCPVIYNAKVWSRFASTGLRFWKDLDRLDTTDTPHTTLWSTAAVCREKRHGSTTINQSRTECLSLSPVIKFSRFQSGTMRNTFAIICMSADRRCKGRKILQNHKRKCEQCKSKAYSYEVTEIELLDGLNENAHGTFSRNSNNSITDSHCYDG